MRFVLAIVLFVCALVSTGLGIAQRTVLLGPDQLVAQGDVSSDAPVTIIDGATLNAMPTTQRLSITGDDDTVFAAYGRTADVMAWVGDASYNTVSYDPDTRSLTGETVDGDESEVPSPDGSDLWLDQRDSDTGDLTWSLQLDQKYSVIVTGQGDDAAPGDISIRWPLDNSTPWSGPLIAGGLGLLLLGLLAFLWALIHARRRRGPRRKQPRLPRPPKPPQLTARKQRALTAGPALPDRGRRRSFAVLSVLVAGGLLLSGCSSLGLPLPGDTTPTPTATAEGDPDAQAPAVTPSQLSGIMKRITSTVADADAALDVDLIKTRMTGPALTARTTNYAIRAADAAQPALPAIPTEKIEVDLPQQNDGWPRTVFTIMSTPSDPTIAPMALMLVQETPRDQYLVDYAMPLVPKAVVPELASANVGAQRLSEGFDLYKLTPDKLAESYASILKDGEASPDYDLFDAENDPLRTQLAERKQAITDQLTAAGTVTFSNSPGTEDPIVFGTLDVGVIVAVDLNDIITVAPAAANNDVNLTGQVALLLGKATTKKGTIATYGLQMLFFVPPKSDDSAKITLLGFEQRLISATEIP